MKRFDWLRLQCAFFALTAAGAAGCGGGGKECALDTDCPITQYCDDGTCRQVGPADSGPDAGIDATMDAPMGPDAGDAGPTDAGMDAGPAIKRGNVTVLSGVLAGGSMYTFSAQFEDLPEGDGCTRSSEGSCSVTECPAPMLPDDAGVPMDAGPPPDAAPPSLPHAGIISLTGGLMPVQLDPAADGSYMPATAATVLWGMQVPLIFNAVGADVPGFSERLDSPVSLTIMTPAFPEPGPLTVIRTADLPISWTGTSAGMVVARFRANDGMGGYTMVDCRFSPDDGMGVVPASALMRLPAGLDGNFRIRVENSRVAAGVAPWRVTITATTYGLRPDGNEARVDARYE